MIQQLISLTCSTKGYKTTTNFKYATETMTKKNLAIVTLAEAHPFSLNRKSKKLNVTSFTTHLFHFSHRTL